MGQNSEEKELIGTEKIRQTIGLVSPRPLPCPFCGETKPEIAVRYVTRSVGIYHVQDDYRITAAWVTCPRCGGRSGEITNYNTPIYYGDTYSGDNVAMITAARDRWDGREPRRRTLEIIYEGQARLQAGGINRAPQAPQRATKGN